MATGGYIEIYEEPASKRFRFVSEGTSAQLEGVRSTKDMTSFPSIRILNYTGKATVVVSCVTTDAPYRQHPNILVGKNCVQGICYIREFHTDSSNPKIISFPELSIQKCKKSEIPERLEDRKRLNINPFDLAEYGEDDLKRDIHQVRLCFQAFISCNPDDPTIKTQFDPIVSKSIINTRSVAEVRILGISDVYSPAAGGKKIMIFCDRIVKDDIEIRFYEEDAEGRQTLIGLGCFDGSDVHRNVAIAFTTPKYDLKLESEPSNPPKIFVQMVRPSDAAKSNAVRFEYVFDRADKSKEL